jgi:ATP-dependent helicase/nuclease subunit B
VNQLSENRRVQVRFLLGPAGTGKTFRCLEEIRAELKRDPAGPPLLFLAPKQATFQIERQLLSDPELPGYTRLQILSSDRLAEFIMETLGHPTAASLSEEGRVMVLRSLLAQKENELRLFRSSARLPGFAQQLSALLREVQQQGLSADRLIDAAGDQRMPGTLRDKLHDVALVLRAYRQWLNANQLLDAEQALDSAAEALANAGWVQEKFKAAAGMQLWLDGFAEMTPQELRLLSAFVPWCERATLAFCLENEPSVEAASWLSLWSVVAQTFRRCRAELEAAVPKAISIEVLSRDPARGRFAGNQVLAHVEAHWSRPEPLRASRSAEARTPAVREGNVEVAPAREKPLRVVRCATPEAEAVFAAREILHFVRDDGGRFRDCAVLLRTLDGYHDTLRRVLTRYGIPFFLDRRELITHHPLAELTRFALRLAAFGWRKEDWFGALKTGLVHRDDDAIDQLENEALARGWEGAAWTKPLLSRDGTTHRLEPLRRRMTPPFERLSRAVTGAITGPQLAAALRMFWEDLEVETTLERWADEARTIAPTLPAVHEAVPTQMEDWLENIERAFPHEALPVADWLPILEAGLAGLSVGVIPPALDQVLVGTIDRSRNPDLRLALVLGMNETIFPAPPPHAPILTEVERSLLSDVLARKKQSLGISTRQRIAHERYFGYIACTRSRERLVLTCAASSARGVALNPSPFLLQLDKLVPGVFPSRAEEQEHFSVPDWREAEHASELAAPLINESHPELDALATIEPLVGALARARNFKSSSLPGPLPPEIVAGLYPPPFTTSVSALEDFAACPFKFFLRSGLRLKEREEFEVDHRQKGILQHEILSEFHTRATANGKQWRDWPPAEAAELAREIGREKLKQFENGLFEADDARRFTGAVLLDTLARLVSTLV